MEITNAAAALSALGHPRRLGVFRLLVRAGLPGVAAGELARALHIPPPTLTSHLGVLARAGLVVASRDGRSVMYRADFKGLKAVMSFLLDECCQGLEGCDVSKPEVCCD